MVLFWFVFAILILSHIHSAASLLDLSLQHKYLTSQSHSSNLVVEDTMLEVKLDIRMGKKRDLSNFDNDPSIPQIADLMGFYHMVISRIYIAWWKNRKYLSSGSLGNNALLMPEVRREARG